MRTSNKLKSHPASHSPIPSWTTTDCSGLEEDWKSPICHVPSTLTEIIFTAKDFPGRFPSRTTSSRTLCHGSPALSELYYPVGSRQLVKSVCKCCMICRKALAKTRTQLMGDHPEVRTAPARPFECTSVDSSV